MPISSLSISHIRNIQQAELTPSSRINVIYGENGSGKTSLLEAIHFLGLTRSFRTSQFKYLVTQDTPQALVFAQLAQGAHAAKPLGVERQTSGDVRIRYDANTIDLAELAGLLPLQVINTDTFDLLEGSPANRRQFIDWGAFYFDPAFIQVWRGFKRVLQQRNSLLKCGKIDPAVRQVWDREFIQYAQRITELRFAYIEQLIPDFEAILAHLLGGAEIRLNFSPGWDQKVPLDELLGAQLERDIRQGYTSAGPQRADLRVKADGISAAERLSRGQKKLVVSALKLAQGTLYHRLSGRPCVYLIDDLPSELDQQHSRLFCEYLEQTTNQCFITCVDPASLRTVWRPETDVAYFKINAGELVQTH